MGPHFNGFCTQMWLKTQNLTSFTLKMMLNEQKCVLNPIFYEDAAKMSNKPQILYFIGFCTQMLLKTQKITSFALRMLLNGHKCGLKPIF